MKSCLNQMCRWNTYAEGCTKPFGEDCPKSKVTKPMTNADRMDAMSVEEKGRFLYHVMHNMRKAINVEEVIEWLQQPCGGADHE